jgi:hypothetical protein
VDVLLANGQEMIRHPTKLDDNHAAIVAGLRAVGAAVIDLAMVGGGCPDLYVEFQGRVYLLEVKNPDGGRLNLRQKRWRLEWRGRPPIEVWSLDDALAAIGVKVMR